jgi:single-strand DNA-binding protein
MCSDADDPRMIPVIGCRRPEVVHVAGTCPQLSTSFVRTPHLRAGCVSSINGSADRLSQEDDVNETYMTVTGNIVGAVGKRRLTDGTVIAAFRVASNERRYDRTSGTWGDGARLFVAVTCWRRLAENVLSSFVAGDPVIVHGRMYTRDFERDGARVWSTEMEAVAVGPDLARSVAVVTRTPRVDGSAAGSTGDGAARDHAGPDGAGPLEPGSDHAGADHAGADHAGADCSGGPATAREVGSRNGPLVPIAETTLGPVPAPRPTPQGVEAGVRA